MQSNTLTWPDPISSTLPPLYAGETEIEGANGALGRLRPSIDLLGNPEALQQRMGSDGYLYMPGLLHRDEVLAARKEVCTRLQAGGFLETGSDPMQAIANAQKRNAFMPELLTKDNAALETVLHEGPLIDFFTRFFGEPVRYFDFTWFRSVPPGRGTPSHCDIVYMGRGERERLCTVWTPMGDIDFQQGGLMILEGSHKHSRLKSTYGQMDVDAYCENKPDAKAWGKDWGTSGLLSGNPNQIRNALGGRWLTTEFRAGDCLIFTMFTVHASLDNRSVGIRLSSDSRYQPLSTAPDERWVGPNPIGHSRAGKRGRIC